MSTPTPDITTPIVRGPTQQAPALSSLGALSDFVGNWNSPPGTAATGYNVMPLPQTGSPNGFILKDFPYYEELTIAPIAGSAPNRGGDFTQTAYTLFYEQRVYFANNPAAPPADQVQDSLVHAENGSWLHLQYGPQELGPYGPGMTPPPTSSQPTNREYVKQVSVPHGNSILAVGSATPFTGRPSISPSDRTTPPLNDPSVIDPNTVLTKQLDSLQQNGVTVDHGVTVTLSTDNTLGGNVSDILFEQRHATVTSFDTTWWIEYLSNGTKQLQYTQTIWMMILVNGTLQKFQHIDANTLVPA